MTVSSTSISPKFSITATTNILGTRFFLYSLKIYQSIAQGVYVPIVIGIWSSIEYQDFFKRLLIFLYETICFNPSSNDLRDLISEGVAEADGNKSHKNGNLNEDEIENNVMLMVHNFRFLEMTNFLVFLTKIIKPPPFTELKINLHFSSVSLYFSSTFDLPNKDSSIQVLLDSLELTLIIKLWSSLLSEKNVILIGNRNLLYPACSALLALLFPFNWVHTYIPVFPDQFELEILDAPTPYLIGLPRERKDFKELCDLYPNHVICCLSTSRISKVNYIDIPEQEETKMRTKIRYLRYPKLERIDEVVDEPAPCEIKDIVHDSSFPQNVQRIFFRIFKDNLWNFEKYLKNKQFDQISFIENLENIEDRQFWEEIINSQAFENFILEFSSYDCERTNGFKSIMQIAEDEQSKFTKNNSYSILFRIPNDVSYLFETIKYRNRSTEVIEKIDTLINDYRMIAQKVLVKPDINIKKMEKLKSRFNSCNVHPDDENIPYSINTNSRKLPILDINYTSLINDERKISTNFTPITKSDIKKYLASRHSSFHQKPNSIKQAEIYGEQGFIQFFKSTFEGLSDHEIDSISLQSLVRSTLVGFIKENEEKFTFRFNESDMYLNDYDGLMGSPSSNRTYLFI